MSGRSAATGRFLTVALGLLSGCVAGEANDDDTDRVQPPDDDDSTYAFTGRVYSYATDEGIPDVEVGVGSVSDVTGPAGGYTIPSPADAPQQVDVYEGASTATSYADCERVHDHGVWSAPTTRGGEELDVRVWLPGYSGVGPVSGRWVRELEGGNLTIIDVTGEQPEESAGGWSIGLETAPATRWWLTLAELDGGVVRWGLGEGGVIEEPDTEIEVTLATEGLVTGAWDGALDAVVTEVSIMQVVGMVDSWFRLLLPLGVWAPSGEVAPLRLVDRADFEFEVVLQRADGADCDWHEQGFTVDLAAPEDLLVVPTLFALPRLQSPRGGVEFGFRPEVRWTGLLEEEGAWNALSLWTFPVDGGTPQSWTIVPDPLCAPETATWPSGFDPVPPEAWGWASAYTYGATRWASCSASFEWPAL